MGRILLNTISKLGHPILFWASNVFVSCNGWEKFLKFMSINAIYILHELWHLTVRLLILIFFFLLLLFLLITFAYALSFCKVWLTSSIEGKKQKKEEEGGQLPTSKEPKKIWFVATNVPFKLIYKCFVVGNNQA